MKPEKYDLVRAIDEIFFKTEPNSDLMKFRVNEILTKTKLSFDEFQELACQNQTVGQLKYRILGLMDKKKIPSTHIA